MAQHDAGAAHTRVSSPDGHPEWTNMDSHPIEAAPLTRLAPFIGASRVEAAVGDLATLANALQGRRLVVITGDDRCKGGVYEILRSLLPYFVGAGIDVMWADVQTHPDARPALEFFHVLAHGHPPSPYWVQDLTVHREGLRNFGSAGAAQLMSRLRRTDVVFAHDTQTALCAGTLKAHGWPVVWHAQIGSAVRNELTAAYWDVFGDPLASVDRSIFYLDEYIPPSLRHNASCALPSVDPSVSKNAVMAAAEARRVLRDKSAGAAVCGRFDRLTAESMVAVQVSRWDKLKDMAGVAEGFRRIAERRPDFHGLIVGTLAQSANEREQLQSCVEVVGTAASEVAERLHVWSVPDSGSRSHDDTIAAVQCAADIVVQKSLQEGFGLTVSEAMLKAKPVIAGGVGGIPTQIQHGHTGLLLDEPADIDHFTDVLESLCTDPAQRRRLGDAAQNTARRRFTIDVQVRALAALLAP